MKAVVQRVSEASVAIDGEVVSAIGRGFLILLGITHSDGEAEARVLAHKIAGLRVFEDAAGKMNLGLTEVGGEALVVSQFTLYGDARKGRRPNFIEAARPEQAEPLVERFIAHLRAEGIATQSGRFQAFMAVRLCNDGPVTLVLDTAQMARTGNG
jgi:D-tyrosyl-tRNA(Tyr) deacylase